MTATDGAGNVGTAHVHYTVDDTAPVSGPLGPWLDIGLVVVALAALMVVLFLFRRRKKEEPEQSSQQEQKPAT